MNTKTCSKCRTEYPATFEFFRADKKGHNGFRSWCRTCCCLDRAKWEIAHLETERMRKTRYRIAHPEANRVSCARWRAAHPEVVRAGVARWDAAHPEAHRARNTAARAVQAARLVYPDACERCDKSTHKLDKHHPDYARPLDVVFLCRRCHKKVHLELALIGGSNG